MKIKISRNFLFLTAYAVLALVCFLYLLFPGKAVKDYILAVQAERHPSMFLFLDYATLAFPPGLKLDNVSFGFKDNTGAIIHSDSLALRPYFWGCISGKPALFVSARAYGGVVEGILPFSFFSGKGASAKTDVKFSGLAIEKCSYLRENLGRRITGELEGSVVYGNGGQLNFTARKGSYQLLESLFGLDKLDFNSVEGQISLKGGVLRINKLRLKGDKINCSIKGDIVLKDDIRKSELNLNSAVEIVSLNNKKVSMLITGTIGNAITKYI